MKSTSFFRRFLLRLRFVLPFFLVFPTSASPSAVAFSRCCVVLIRTSLSYCPFPLRDQQKKRKGKKKESLITSSKVYGAMSKPPRNSGNRSFKMTNKNVDTRLKCRKENLTFFVFVFVVFFPRISWGFLCALGVFHWFPANLLTSCANFYKTNVKQVVEGEKKNIRILTKKY